MSGTGNDRDNEPGDGRSGALQPGQPGIQLGGHGFGRTEGPVEEPSPPHWNQQPQAPLETTQLDLADTEERLPWLESSDENDQIDSASADTGRFLALAAMATVAAAAIVGGIWWASHRSPDPAMVADGSVIAAPKQPYKEAPQNPGGKTFAGTGDSSFAVSDGQTRPARLDEAKGAETPAVAAVPAATSAAKANPAPAPAAKSAAPAGATTIGVGVQVGAFSSHSTAETGWTKLVGQSRGALSGVSHRIVAGKADIGTVYRLQAVADDSAAANALCGKLKDAGLSCQVK